MEKMVLIICGALFLLTLFVFGIEKVKKLIKIKNERNRLEKLKCEFKNYFGQKPAEDKLLKDYQIKTVVKPTLKRFAEEFEAVCKNEASLQHQIKYEPINAPYDAVVNHFNDAKKIVQANKTIFYSALKVAIDLKFVPENTNFKKCLNF